ncbi:restriction endonuclease subunit S [Flavobacteriaceae bacterium XHP0103]|uniref:restriction endonuclease subunit S n=1 Tax=Marixanthotalea marina TaxID=2844359 RepID=UPI002989C809|nr:restriction endonuclease subunit S [Marixanthotalea marina]MBU3821453.1 restriction endonuclease subunit S [Marixanthotalea marina]
MNVSNVQTKMVRLGDYIELNEQRNSNLKYGFNDVRGCSNKKEIQPTKADISNRSFDNFFIVQPKEFVFNRRTTRMGDRLGLGYNSSDRAYIFTNDYVCFRVKDVAELLPTYLYIFFLRTEFDRYARYDSWGSATEFFDWDSMCEVQIPLPDIDTQQELVDTYNGLKALAEQNEALIEPLTQACQAYIVDCKKKYPEVELSEYIEEVNEKNADGKYNQVQGLSTTKQFREPNSRVDKSKLHNYKIVYNNCFAYVPTTDTWKVFACALNKKNTFVVSPIYCVFKVTNNLLLTEYLNILFQPKEFDRYVRYNSWGSARENFNFSALCKVKIPLPPPEVQQAIVNLYNCAEEAKKIANEAREKMQTLCPALVQKAING